MLDKRSNTRVQEMFPATLRIFDVSFGCITTKFYIMNLLEGRDASTVIRMFGSQDNFFSVNEIEWSRVTAFSQDITNLNFENYNSIKTLACKKMILLK